MVETIVKWARRRWKTLGLSILLVVVLVSAVYSYSTYLKRQSTPYVSATSPPLELRMELDKTEFQPSETVVVRLFLKNIGSETITINFPHFAGGDAPPFSRVLNFIVKDENDTTVYIHFITFFTSVYKFVLEPGEQRAEILEWTQTCNREPYAGQTVKQGSYKIIGTTVNYGTPAKKYKLETPAIAITIG